jgi:hypothetical protein
VKACQTAGQPALSVDTKKKELVGDFKNGGRELRPKGQPEAVRVHDFALPELGKVAPYGVYDIAANAGVAPGCRSQAGGRLGRSWCSESTGIGFVVRVPGQMASIPESQSQSSLMASLCR